MWIKEITETSQFKMGRELALDGEACIEVLHLTLEKKASLRFCVRGFSMSPFIKDGDIITLSGLSAGRIGLGQSIAFRRPCDKKLIIHRLVKIHKSPQMKYITKGDNAKEPDCPISLGDMLAYVKKVERNGKKILFGLGPERKIIAFLSRQNILRILSFFGRFNAYFIWKNKAIRRA